MLFNTREVAEMFMRFMGDEPPCVYNDLDQALPEYCELACGEASVKDCWKKFIEEGKI